jgi:hypothetical protein
MPIKKNISNIKSSKKIIKSQPIDDEEDTLAVIKRINAQKDKEKKEKEKQDKIEADFEKERIDDIIYEYVDKTFTAIKDKDLTHFWVFADRSGFKKYKNSLSEMKKILQQDVDKYSDRILAHIAIGAHHKDSPDSIFANDAGIWLDVNISVHHTDDNALINGKYKSWGCHYGWTSEDFAVTKFSFKLLEAIMNPISKKVMTCPSLFGTPLNIVLKRLKEKGYNLDEFLNPLAGV